MCSVPPSKGNLPLTARRFCNKRFIVQWLPCEAGGGVTALIKAFRASASIGIAVPVPAEVSVNGGVVGAVVVVVSVVDPPGGVEGRCCNRSPELVDNTSFTFSVPDELLTPALPEVLDAVESVDPDVPPEAPLVSVAAELLPWEPWLVSPVTGGVVPDDPELELPAWEP